jgi:biotin carboxyl carrier protein
MKKFRMSVNGDWYEIEIKSLDQSPISVLVDGELYRVELEPDEVPEANVPEVREEPEVSAPKPTLEVSRPALRQAQGAAAEGEVIAPMPGKILAINVRVGDRVQHGEVLCTLEAMKMENEIMASASGVVKEVKVTEGQDVLYGDGLFIIEA